MARILSERDFERWRAGIDQWAMGAAWDRYDCEMQQIVGDFNRHLSTTPYYFSLDWRYIKAIAWVETGARNDEWTANPMQIGVLKGGKTDPGLADLLANSKGGELILPPCLKGQLTPYQVVSVPSASIRAATGYLLMRLARFGLEHREDGKDEAVYSYTVKPGDSLDRIARNHGTTVDVLRKLNSGAPLMLQPGQALAYRKAAWVKAIVGWRTVDAEAIALYYNGGGDNTYARKIAYAFDVVKKKKAQTCAQ